MIINWSRQNARKISTVFCISFLLWSYHCVQKLRYCDLQEQRKVVQTPTGDIIPYYTDSPHVKTFGDLAGKCHYDDTNRIKCPDVRLKGESLNRQGMLVIARMHAIFDLICKRHNIAYWIFAGTLLGAQRNGLMIPWDYDSDIGIMMDDLMELMKYLRQDLPSDIYVQDGVENPNLVKWCEVKLRDNNSCYGHCLRTGCRRHDGLQIDIFAFRRLESDPSKIKSHYYEKVLDYNEIYPPGQIRLEGLTLPSPKNIHGVLTRQFGPNYLSLPDKLRYQCGKNGYTAIPWYSCEAIRGMSPDLQMDLLRLSMDHGSLYFWYYG